MTILQLRYSVRRHAIKYTVNTATWPYLVTNSSKLLFPGFVLANQELAKVGVNHKSRSVLCNKAGCYSSTIS